LRLAALHRLGGLRARHCGHGEKGGQGTADDNSLSARSWQRTPTSAIASDLAGDR
jgi:hypothetical protein